MANINDNFLVNLSQSLGISYDLKKNALGSMTEPNTALFSVMQVASILTSGKPLFGVYENANSFSSMTFVNNSDVVGFQFSPGIVFYQKRLVNMPSQTVPIKSTQDSVGSKLFKFYLDYSDFSLSSQIFNFTIVSISDNVITVDQTPSIRYASNYTTLSVNNFIFNVYSIDVSTNTIVLSQNITNYASVGSTVSLIFQPVVKYVHTFTANGEPPDINIPSTGIILASAVVNITENAGVFEYDCPLGVESLFESYPIYSNPSGFFPNAASYAAFVASVNNAVRAYQTIQNYEIETAIANSFALYTKDISSNQLSFDNYWKQQPFKRTDLFQYGIGFNGLQKVDFDSRFKDFWYYNENVDLTRTYAIFRGDIYGGNAYVGQSAGLFNNGVSVKNLVDFTGKSTILNGTQAYGVSAVIPSGEYVPRFSSASNYYFNKQVNNYVSWNKISNIDDLLFFHVYRSTQESNGFVQERITTPFDVSGFTISDDILTNISSSQGIASSHFAVKIKNDDLNEGIIGGIAFNAFILDNSSLTGIQSCEITASGSGYIQPYAVINGSGFGAQISLSTSSGGGISSAIMTSFGSGYSQLPTISIFDAYSGSGGNSAIITPVLSKLSCGIYSGATYPSGPLIGELEDIPIASITSTYVMNMPVKDSSFISLSSSASYWAVFQMNTPYALQPTQYLKFKNSTGFSTSFASSNDGVAWTTSTTASQVAKLGYLDQGSSGTKTSSRGVYLTNDQAAYPCRMQLFVPNLDLSTLTFDDIGTTTNSIVFSTTPIQNSMIVYVDVENTQTGIQSTLIGSLPRGTSRGSSVLLGNTTDLYDLVLDVVVVPDISQGVNTVPGTSIITWTIYDLFTVDSVPS